MKKKMPEEYRVKQGLFSSTESHGANGCFLIPFESYTFTVLVSDGEGWDHVSVSLKGKAPNWKAMSHIKDLFFEEAETVVQFHPKKSEYVNNHPHCLHLWRKQDTEHELPPSILIGFKNLGILKHADPSNGQYKFYCKCGVSQALNEQITVRVGDRGTVEAALCYKCKNEMELKEVH